MPDIRVFSAFRGFKNPARKTSFFQNFEIG